MFAFTEFFLAVGASALTLLVVVAAVHFSRSKRKLEADDALLEADEISFTFKGGRCVAASRPAIELLDAPSADDIALTDAARALSVRFEELPVLLDYHGEQSAHEEALDERLASSVEDDIAQLHVRAAHGGELMLRLHDPVQATSVDRHKSLSSKARFKLIRNALDHVHLPIWFEDGQGDTLWSNKAYGALKTEAETSASALAYDAQKALNGTGDRIPHVVDENSGQTHWYDVFAVELEREQRVNYAINVDGLIEAETAQRKFVQTLAKTFAQLSTALAIFDRNRQLVLFNPALIDLTALPAHFLSTQPNLQSFFDKLRENRIMPEPKDYASWRRQIADLVIQSSGGNYQETWALPTGLTYRVTGRPHPDGAIAILIEDITAEVTLTRRFKGQIELANSALEALSDAIVVFAHDGSIAYWNSALMAFCDLPSSTKTSDMSRAELITICAKKSVKDKDRDQLKFALQNPGEVGQVKGRLTLKNGTIVPYEFRTHEGAATILTLHTTAQAKAERFEALTPAL